MLSVKNSLKSTKDPLWILSIIFPGMGGRAGEITSGVVVHAGIAPRVEGMGVDRRDASVGTVIPAGVTGIVDGAVELVDTVVVIPPPVSRGIPAREKLLGNVMPGVPATLPAERAEPVSC